MLCIVLQQSLSGCVTLTNLLTDSPVNGQTSTSKTLSQSITSPRETEASPTSLKKTIPTVNYDEPFEIQVISQKGIFEFIAPKTGTYTVVISEKGSLDIYEEDQVPTDLFAPIFQISQVSSSNSPVKNEQDSVDTNEGERWLTRGSISQFFGEVGKKYTGVVSPRDFFDLNGVKSVISNSPFSNSLQSGSGRSPKVDLISGSGSLSWSTKTPEVLAVRTALGVAQPATKSVSTPTFDLRQWPDNSLSVLYPGGVVFLKATQDRQYEGNAGAKLIRDRVFDLWLREGAETYPITSEILVDTNLSYQLFTTKAIYRQGNNTASIDWMTPKQIQTFGKSKLIGAKPPQTQQELNDLICQGGEPAQPGTIERRIVDHYRTEFCANPGANAIFNPLESLWDPAIKAELDKGVSDATQDLVSGLQEYLETASLTNYLQNVATTYINGLAAVWEMVSNPAKFFSDYEETKRFVLESKGYRGTNDKFAETYWFGYLATIVNAPDPTNIGPERFTKLAKVAVKSRKIAVAVKKVNDLKEVRDAIQSFKSVFNAPAFKRLPQGFFDGERELVGETADLVKTSSEYRKIAQTIGEEGGKEWLRVRGFKPNSFGFQPSTAGFGRGIDDIWEKDGFIYVIEYKANTARLSTTVNGSLQMSGEWIDTKIEELSYTQPTTAQRLSNAKMENKLRGVVLKTTFDKDKVTNVGLDLNEMKKAQQIEIPLLGDSDTDALPHIQYN